MLINESLTDNLTEFSKATIKDRYAYEGETIQQAFARASTAFSSDDAMAQRIYNYAAHGWLSFASPVLSNAPVRENWNETDWRDNLREAQFTKARGLPISCFLNYVPDSRQGLGDHYIENIWLASSGGGIGGYWGHVRSNGTRTSNGSASSGSVPFMHVVDSQMLAFNQGITRRGSYAIWTDISHPEILEILDIRKPTGGDTNRRCLNLHHGINLSNKFMRVIDNAQNNPDADTSWELIDPHTGNVVDVVDARMLWARIHSNRAETGEPFIMFKDTVNEALPEALKEKGLIVHHSNLCSEITLPTNEDRTAVCCLSSLNLEKWDEWKDDENFIADVVMYLDNVLEYFIINAPEGMDRARLSAASERSIGIGALGWHYLLQSRNLPFGSPMAVGLNRRIFKHIKDRALEASQALAKTRGEPDDLIGTGVRNAHLLAIAPNASSSIIMGTSPSIEPIVANVFTHKTLSGSYPVRNKYLDRIIRERFSEEDAERVWKDILLHEGSVQHVDFLDDWEKEVYLTAYEIDQRWIIDHAADRQQYICQSQSLNLFLPPGTHVSTPHSLVLRAWKKGLKSLYYQRSTAKRRAEKISQKVERMYLDDKECLSCEG
jgi:ribonucleoside-diphosphate reductase alpha chain